MTEPISHGGRSSPIIRLGILVFGIICLVTAPFALWVSVQNFLRARASTAWPSVPATVVEASIEEDIRRRDKRMFSVRVSYSYTVGAQSFTSRRLYINELSSGMREWAQLELGELTPNLVTPAFYDPAKPDFAILRPGLFVRDYVMLLLGPGFLGLGFALFRVTRQPPHRV